METDPFYPAFFYRKDREIIIFNPDRLVDISVIRDLAYHIDKVSSDSLAVFRLKICAQFLVEVVQIHTAVDQVVCIVDLFYALFFFIIFIIDIPDDFLYDVFQCYDAAETAVFIDQYGNMLLFSLQLNEECVDFLRLRNKIRLAEDLTDVHLIEPGLPCFDQIILDMQNSDDIVAAPVTDRHPGISHFHQLIEIFLRRIRNIDHEYIGPGRHDLIGEFVVELENASYHFPSFFPDLTALLSRLEDGHDIVLRILFLVHIRFLTQEPEHQIRNYGKRPCYREKHAINEVLKTCHAKRHAQAVLLADLPGTDLAERKQGNKINQHT